MYDKISFSGTEKSKSGSIQPQKNLPPARLKHERRDHIWHKVNAALALFVEKVESFRYKGRIEASMAMIAARCRYASGDNGRRHVAHMAKRCETLGLMRRVMRNGKTHLWIITRSDDIDLSAHACKASRAEQGAAADDRRRSQMARSAIQAIRDDVREYRAVKGSIQYKTALHWLKTGKLWDVLAAGDDTPITQHPIPCFERAETVTAQPLFASLPVFRRR